MHSCPNVQRKLLVGRVLLLAIAVLIGTGAIASPQDSSVHSAHQGLRAANPSGFERFRHEKNGWKILEDAAVRKCIKATMGNQEEEFWSCAQLTDEPIVTGDELLVVASVRGLSPYMQSILCVNLVNGRCTTGYLTDSKLHIFGAKNEGELPRCLKDYLAHYGQEYGRPDIRFEKPNRSPVKTAEPPKSKKNLNLAIVTGTYKREGSSRFTQATLTVKALPHSKISFEIEASNGGNTGEAQATVPIINDRAVYKEDSGELKLQFKGKQVVVTGDDSYFCGAAVTLLGTYTKIDDKVPAVR